MALAIGGMVERMGTIRYVLGYQFDDEEFFEVITTAYLNAARIVGDYQLESREQIVGGVEPLRATSTPTRNGAGAGARPP